MIDLDRARLLAVIQKMTVLADPEAERVVPSSYDDLVALREAAVAELKNCAELGTPALVVRRFERFVADCDALLDAT